ncbi:glycoside hydrolase family protein [Sphingobacterium thalpophilum]|uniref:glycoside hydrolase family protein n=1 Tax=Sphingobacterium thalpophilum TaxID=259 RepID=UPI000B24FEAA|nr:glycoside hydrolase family protein [Sphingobacterium thalpophilum]
MKTNLDKLPFFHKCLFERTNAYDIFVYKITSCKPKIKKMNRSSRRVFLKNMVGAGTMLALSKYSFALTDHAEEAFIDKLLPAPKGGGFAMENYWIWDPSVIKGEDGKYHMFASRWSKKYGFGNWVTNSEVVRAIADRPEGPYEFVEVVLPARGKQYFDGCTTHNPRIVKIGDYYVLYYFGNTYEDPDPAYSENVWESGLAQKAWMHKRIGMAYAKSISGPWKRVDQPILNPRQGEWDASITSNPSPVVLPDGKVYLVYKSSPVNYNPPLLLGAAQADSFQGPYIRLADKPIFSFHTDQNHENDVEDPFVWHNGRHFELIMKDRYGKICGEEGGGIHAYSKDGIDWQLSAAVKAYSKVIRWNDGSVTHQANFERPFLLFDGGKPTHLFAATGDGTAPYQFERTWNMVIPLKTS